MFTKSSFKILCYVGVFTAVTVLMIFFNSTAGEKMPSLSRAISLAKKQTPLVSVMKNDVTPPGPRKRIIYGTEAEGKEIAVWVGKISHKPVYIYLESGVAEQDILKLLENLDIKNSDITSIVLDYDEFSTKNGSPSNFYWVVYTIQNEKHIMYYIDFFTGKITRTENLG